MTTSKLRVALLLAAAAAVAAPARAQTVVRRDDGATYLDRRIDRALRTQYVAIGTDTTIAADDTIPGALFAFGHRVYIEGTVLGDVIGIEANTYVRPSAHVAGVLVNLNGGLYVSELADVNRKIDLTTVDYGYRVVDGRYVIVYEAKEPRLVLDPISGVHIPRYNRVDGVAVDVGASYRLPRLGSVEPTVHGQAGYRTDRGDFAWEGDLKLQRGDWRLQGGAELATRSNDRWIKGDLDNSLKFLWDGGDLRNYYEATTAFAELARETGDEDTPRRFSFGLRAQQEDASSLETGNPWTLTDDGPFRFNPPINEGKIRSLIPWVGGGVTTPRVVADGRVEVEYGSPSSLAAAAFPDPADSTATISVAPEDDSFWRLHASIDWAMAAIADQTLEIEAQYFTPLAGPDVLPLQRWEMLGGSSTLRTLENGEMVGDHLAYVESKYIIPLPDRLRLPVVGVPQLQLLHAAGSAWSGPRDRRFVQNVGVQLEAFVVYVRYVIDPDSGEDEIGFGVTWPGGHRYPWTEER